MGGGGGGLLWRVQYGKGPRMGGLVWGSDMGWGLEWGAWYGGLIWGACNGGPGVVKNVPNPTSPGR